MKVQWRRNQVLTAGVLAVFISTLALLTYTRQRGLNSLPSLVKYQADANTFKVYEDTLTQSTKRLPTLHKKIERAGIYQTKQELLGSLLDQRGIVGNISTNISTELVFAFSPTAEEKFKEKLVDPNHEQKVYANSPAMIWDGEKFIVVMRMWLDKEHTAGKTMNVFSDNYLYSRTYNDRMEPLDPSGRVLGIPTRVLESIGDGPIEPRAFPFYNQLYLSFNVALFVGKKQMDTTMFWDWAEDKFVMPKLTNGQPQMKRKVSMPRDKHWSAYEYKDQNYMIYSFDPLRIISCNNSAICKFTQNTPDYVFSDVVDCVRGGTPTLHYRDNFYITIAHTTLFKPGNKRYYTVNLVVLKAVDNSKHHIVYLSEPINFHKEIMTKTPMVRTKWIEDPFFFPVTLILEDPDNIVIGGHVNDHSAYLFRVKGIKSIMDTIIAQSSALGGTGPPKGFLHRLARYFASKQSGFQFFT